MKFPAYFVNNPQFKILDSNKAKVIEYFHQSDSIKDVFLDIEQVFLVYVVEGIIKFQSPNGVFYVEEGSCTIVNKGPYIMSESLSGISNCFKAYLFVFEEEALEDFYFENPTSNSDLVSDMKHILPIDACNFIETLINSLSLLFNKDYDKPMISNLIDLKTNELLHYLGMNNLSTEIHKMLYPVLNDDYKLKKIIKNNYLSNLNIKELAFLSNMSLSSFKRKFIDIYEDSPSKWIKERKLEYAYKLIITGKFKVNEIAYKSGFENPSTFSRLFKNRYGTTPKNYMQ